MKVYVFGNRDYGPDSVVFGVVEEFKAKRKELSAKGLVDVEFVGVAPNEDVPFVGDPSTYLAGSLQVGSGPKRVVIMDVVMGIDEITVLTEKDLEKLELAPRGSAHEFDLGWQLKYLRKLGKLGEVRIVGLPMGKKVDVNQVVAVLGRLVNEEND